MIPLQLQDGLEKRMQLIFKDFQYKRPAKEDEEIDPLVPIHIYTQNLPVKQSKDDSPFPFILIRLLQGRQEDMIDSDHLVQVNLIVGMYDNEKDNQGYRDVSLALNKIFESLSRNPIIDGVFPLDTESELNWSLSDEETDPFYFGGLSATFVAPKFQREDLEVFI